MEIYINGLGCGQSSSEHLIAEMGVGNHKKEDSRLSFFYIPQKEYDIFRAPELNSGTISNCFETSFDFSKRKMM